MERLIFHVDVNSAFLSWEAAKRVKEGLPDLREIPSCIGGGTCGSGTAEMSGSRVRAGGFCAVPEMFPGV